MRYDHTVPNSPTGTETRNTSRHDTGASTPPSTRPMNEPAMPATAFTPSARPRWLWGNASVRIAEELANRKRAADALADPHHDQPQRAGAPCIQVTESSTEKTVKTAKPRLNMRTRP